jgi:phosphohistidine swiveling domain-containing protein
MDIVWLGDPACRDLLLVGGKAANLSRVARDYNVPTGFCLTVEFFDHLESERQNFGESRRPALPPALLQLLANAYEMLAARCGNEHLAVAVRSSAVEEDSHLASFAGAYETYLNVVGVEDLATAVVRCWASAGSTRAREYRRSRGLAIEAVRVAVLVQQFVPADVSAVVFSADPVSGRDDEVVIDANWGLGESIVAGRATPDTYVVRKREPAIVSRAIADKRVITIAAARGTRDVTVPRVLRRRPVLDEARAIELTVLARNLEARLGWPVDIECSYRGEDLHLLQCRPLTTLRVVDAQARTASLKEAVLVSSATNPPAPSPIIAPPDFPALWEPSEDAQLYWTRERMHAPEPLPPLAEPFLRHCYEHGINLAAKPYSWPIRVRARRINTYWYLTFTPLGVAPHELDAMNERSQEACDRAIGRLREIWHTEVLPEVQRYLADWEAFDLRAATWTQLTAHLERTIARSERVWELHFVVGLPICVALSAFDDLCEDLFGDGGALEKYRLLQGLDNKSLETDRTLWQLSRKARAAPEVRAAVEQSEPGDLMPALQRTAEGRQFVADLRAFLAHYGQRAVSILVSDRSWIEDPTPVFTNLREYAAQPDRDLAGEQRERALDRERLVADVRHRLQDYPAALARQFDLYLKAAQEASVLMEDHNFWIDQRAVYQIRRVLLEFGRRFSEAGVIGNPDDVFHLTLDELRQTASALPTFDRRRLVRSRQAEIEHFRSMTPPPALGTMPAGPPPDTPLGRTFDMFFGVPVMSGPDPHTLRGHPASAGIVRGPARVVRSLCEADSVRAGDILVAVTTLPAWTPLFATVAAVVTDVGGVTSHCAVVAREYGIPAVVGTTLATSVIRDGQLLEVDGQAGSVRILGNSS